MIYVLVNNKGKLYRQEDYLGFDYIVDFDSKEDAKVMLEEFIETGELDANDGWHIESHRG